LRVAAEVIEAGTDWCDAEAAARHLEEVKSTVRAELAVAWMDDGASAAKADAKALAAPEYRQHIQAMVEARRKANVSRVLYDGAKLKADMLRTVEASHRAEINLR
jgi:hypothetical protein